MTPASADVVIRDALPTEYDAVSELLDASYAEYRPGDDVRSDWREGFEAYRNDLRDVRSRLADSVLIVAERNGGLVGTVTYYPPSDSQPVGEGWPQGWAGVRLLGVHPEARGLRIGRLLTEECLRRARTHGAVTVGLHTTLLMEVARGMYERMGFTRLPDHDFHPMPDFVVMAYKLDLA